MNIHVIALSKFPIHNVVGIAGWGDPDLGADRTIGGIRNVYGSVGLEGVCVGNRTSTRLRLVDANRLWTKVVDGGLSGKCSRERCNGRDDDGGSELHLVGRLNGRVLYFLAFGGCKSRLVQGSVMLQNAILGRALNASYTLDVLTRGIFYIARVQACARQLSKSVKDVCCITIQLCSLRLHLT